MCPQSFPFWLWLVKSRWRGVVICSVHWACIMSTVAALAAPSGSTDLCPHCVLSVPESNYSVKGKTKGSRSCWAGLPEMALERKDLPWLYGRGASEVEKGSDKGRGQRASSTGDSRGASAGAVSRRGAQDWMGWRGEQLRQRPQTMEGLCLLWAGSHLSRPSERPLKGHWLWGGTNEARQRATGRSLRSSRRDTHKRLLQG